MDDGQVRSITCFDVIGGPLVVPLLADDRSDQGHRVHLIGQLFESAGQQHAWRPGRPGLRAGGLSVFWGLYALALVLGGILHVNRALRIDKFTLAALETVLRMYYDHETVVSRIPTLKMLTASPDIMNRRAKLLVRMVKKSLAEKCSIAVKVTGSRVGGGALPEEDLESRAVVLDPLDRTVNELEKNLRMNPLPVIGRIEEDRYILDMRTVADDEVPIIANILGQVFRMKL